MPGKQLAIDADLNAGLITESEARQRRKDIQRSADFYGAMDGASKFVRGDAIAAVIIVAINTIGGFIVGVAQQHLDFVTSLQKFTLLTVGEGIVDPSSRAPHFNGDRYRRTRAAILESDFGRDITRQLLAQPNAILIAAIMMGVFGPQAGLGPLVTPHALGDSVLRVLASSQRARWDDCRYCGVVATGRHCCRRRPRSCKARRRASCCCCRTILMELEIGFGLIPLVDVNQGGDLLERITLDSSSRRARSRHCGSADSRAR